MATEGQFHGVLLPLQEITASEEIRVAGSQLFRSLFEPELQCLEAKFKEKQQSVNESQCRVAELKAEQTYHQQQLQGFLLERTGMEDLIRRLTQTSEQSHQRNAELIKKVGLTEQQVKQCESVIGIQKQELTSLHSETAKQRTTLAEFEASLCDVSCANSALQVQNRELQGQVSRLQIDLDAAREKCRVLVSQLEHQQQQHKQELKAQTQEYEASLVGLVGEASRGANQQMEALKQKFITLKVEYDRVVQTRALSDIKQPPAKPQPAIKPAPFPPQRQHPLLQQLRQHQVPRETSFPRTKMDIMAESPTIKQNPPDQVPITLPKVGELEQQHQEESLQKHTPQHQPLRKKKRTVDRETVKKATIFDYYEEY